MATFGQLLEEDLLEEKEQIREIGKELRKRRGENDELSEISVWLCDKAARRRHIA